MNHRITFALTTALLSTTIAGCSLHSAPKTASVYNKVDPQNVGLGVRAQAALAQNDTVAAIGFAERAVAATPSDAGFRGLLGNAYFAGGRFASAEAAYRDSLALSPNQPQLLLKLALVSIAQGKNGQALDLLSSARTALDPADYGLALALAGQPEDAATLLQSAAEQVGADARVRQNLALALALSGDWTGARSVAAQDVPADQVDARVQQWMQMAKPSRASDQVVALTGIAPAASDPGMPSKLALAGSSTRLAAAPPSAAPVADVAPTEVAEVAPAVMSRPIELSPALPTLDPLAPAALPKPGLSPRAAALTDARTIYRRAVVANAKASPAVVQLGAFAARSTVTGAWSKVSARFPSLRGYTPVAARFDGERGTVYRLAVHGFTSEVQARNLCGALRKAGGTCFVRTMAGDAPVQMASRSI